MRAVARIVVLKSTIQKLHKHGHRLWVLAFISFLIFVSFAAVLVKEINFFQARSFESKVMSNTAKRSDIPMDVMEALVHYAGTNISAQMSQEEINEVAHTVLMKRPCNFLVFGLGHESFLWRILNYGGRTVFLDEREMWVNGLEEKHPEMEVYEVQYTTKVSESGQLMAMAKEQSKTECRPVQDLLFSDCKLGLIDLPNDLYKVNWDVILIDGPRGYFPGAPGRMSAIFTAAVLGRSKNEFKATDIFVHDSNREVEKVYSNEFLCGENKVSSTGNLAHYRIETMGKDSVNFCNKNSTSRAPMS